MAHALVFDSGVGGLSVVEELRRLLPDLYLTYVADDEFRPYGDKSEAQLKQRLPALLQTLVLASDPDVVVLACNTASTTALAEIRAALNVPVIGVVPAIKPAAQQSRTKTIAVLGTPGTVKRQYVDQLIADHASDCQVALHGSTKLVSMAERKLAGLTLNDAAIANEIAPLFQGQHGTAIDTIVLACTHFPLLVAELKKNAPRRVSWIDSGSAIARRTQSVLADIDDRPLPIGPQTALLIGGQANMMRVKLFERYGFKETVALSSYDETP